MLSAERAPGSPSARRNGGGLQDPAGYSTTLTELRARRQAWRQARDERADSGAGAWSFDGYVHPTAGDRLLVNTAAEKHREMRRIAREETADLPDLS